MSLAIYENYSNTFKANLKGKEHKKKCWARNSELNQEYSTNDYNTKDFIEKLISSKSNKKNSKNVTGSNNNIKHKKLTTLKDLFIYCRTHDVDGNIQGEYIRNMFLDDRNMNFYNDVGVNGYKMMMPTKVGEEISIHNQKNKMSLKYGQLSVTLNFENKTVLNNVKKKLSLDSDRDLNKIRIVVATKWFTYKKDGVPKMIYGEIVNAKQIIDVSSYEI
ncbi:hypothetical protein [Staphylococcus ureilyticus]|uniref:hypothetical protein n=1 Tax=Staphylococcus ureilyticus TaxID=94138 RepID=UPI0039E057D5